jgi:serine/threonine-protein kinase RsbW
MRLVVDLTMPTEARLISQTRRAFSGYLRELGVDNDEASDVVLALAEACSNVLRHAFGGEGEGETFRLSAELATDEVVVVVEDDGVGLPADAGDNYSDPSATSGRGLHLIRELVTSVDVETAPDRQGTRLQMRKSLKAAGLSGED